MFYKNNLRNKFSSEFSDNILLLLTNQNKNMDVNETKKEQGIQFCTVSFSDLRIAVEIKNDFFKLSKSTTILKMNNDLSKLSNKFLFPHVYFDKQEGIYHVFAEYLILAKLPSLFAGTEKIHVLLYSEKPKSVVNISNEYLLTLCANNLTSADSASLLMNKDEKKEALLKRLYGENYTGSQRNLEKLSNLSRASFRQKLSDRS